MYTPPEAASHPAMCASDVMFEVKWQMHLERKMNADGPARNDNTLSEKPTMKQKR